MIYCTGITYFPQLYSDVLLDRSALLKVHQSWQQLVLCSFPGHNEYPGLSHIWCKSSAATKICLLIRQFGFSIHQLGFKQAGRPQRGGPGAWARPRPIRPLSEVSPDGNMQIVRPNGCEDPLFKLNQTAFFPFAPCWPSVLSKHPFGHAATLNEVFHTRPSWRVSSLRVLHEAHRKAFGDVMMTTRRPSRIGSPALKVLTNTKSKLLQNG